MSKTEALKTEITRVLKLSLSKVSFGRAPAKKVYPYAVYDLSEIGSENGRTNFQLEVNVVDYGPDTSRVDDISDDIQDRLHRYDFINSAIQFTSYIGIRQPVTEEDKEINRRRMLFEIQLHELKGE